MSDGLKELLKVGGYLATILLKCLCNVVAIAEYTLGTVKTQYISQLVN